MVRIEYERYSRPYKPDVVKVLLVGESPPFVEEGQSARYFYNIDDESRSLAKCVAPLFNVDATKPGWKRKFLETFRDSGYYLIDLSKEPINDLPRRERRARRRKCAPDLAKEVGSLHPERVIVLMIGLDKDIRPLIEAQDIPCESVYFPPRWGTESFKNALRG